MNIKKNFDIKNITTLLFDNDGIFVDTEELYFKANQKILKDFGIKLSKDRYINETLVTGEGFDSLIPNWLKEKEDPRPLRARRNKIYLELLENELVIIPFAKETLEKIKKSGRFKVGVITSSQRTMFHAIHEKTDFKKYFDFVVDRESVSRLKPFPDPYLRGLKLAKSMPEETLAIEDSQRGLSATHAAKINCIVIPTKLTKNQNFSKAYKVLENLNELLKLLELK